MRTIGDRSLSLADDAWFTHAWMWVAGGQEKLDRTIDVLRELRITAEMSTAIVDMADLQDGIVWIRWTK